TAKIMRQTIHGIHQLMDKPFGANVCGFQHLETTQDHIAQTNELLAALRGDLGITPVHTGITVDSKSFEEQIDDLLEDAVPIVSFSFGIPAKIINQKLKAASKTLIRTATTVKEAVMNEENGMDMVVVQGSEAGGHRGTFAVPFEKGMIGTMALVPQAADHVSIPVIAAGGIMDARGVRAAFALGAQGVQMGTAFVTSVESGAKEQHKNAVLNSTEDRPVVTSAFSG